MQREVTLISVTLFMLAMLAFVPLVIVKSKQASDERIDRECSRLEKESKWGHLAPPMEADDVWMARRQAEKEMCAAIATTALETNDD